MEPPLLSGYLHRQKGNAIFKNWNRRYVELRENTLVYSVLKGGLRMGDILLGPHIVYADSSQRHFCFSLTNCKTGEVQYFAADNITVKETWSEKIQLVLMKLKQLQHLQTRNDDDSSSVSRIEDKLTSQYQNRPILYIKVVQARNLFDNTENGNVNSYVVISFGKSTVKTVTRKKTINPMWGMVFNFDLERSSRYAKIEVYDEDFNGNDVFLGMVLIPVLPLRDGYSNVSWYPLGKKSSRIFVRGEIEIELSCIGDADPGHKSWHFFREVRQLPELTLNLTRHSPEGININSSNSNSNQSSKDNLTKENNASSLVQVGGFPLQYPPIEVEFLEDISIRVQMQCLSHGSKINCRGVLLLTNYRLLFISFAKILSMCELNASQMTLVQILSNNPTDLTTQFPIASITHVMTETDTTNGSADVLKIKTTDNRSISFTFRDEIEFFSSSSSSLSDNNGNARKLSDDDFQTSMNIENSVHYLQQLEMIMQEEEDSSFSTALDISRGMSFAMNSQLGGGAVARSVSKKRLEAISLGRVNTIADDNTEPTDFERTWLQLIKLPSFVVDAIDASEGYPCFRFCTRFRHYIKNRPHQQLKMITIHSELMSSIENQIVELVKKGSMTSRRNSTQTTDDSENQNQCTQGKLRPVDSSTDSLKSTECWAELEVLNGEVNAGMSDVIGSSTDTMENTAAPTQLPLGWSSEHALERTPTTTLEFIEYNSNLSTYILNMKTLSYPACVRIQKLICDVWNIYDPIKELERMSIPDWLWRVTSINENYELSSTYPAVLAVPVETTDEDLRGSAAFRSKGRIPVLVWRNLVNNCTITRCSQPHVGMSNHRSTKDENLLAEINHCGGQYAHNRYATTNSDQANEVGKPFIIVDARPLLNATANQAVGKGTESEKFYENTSVIFMDIPNIHAIRKSHEQLEEACLDENNWLAKLDSSNWLTNLRKILKAATRIVHYLAYDDLSVLVHCSDGWDRTSQLTSLSMLMLDPYYRTLKGFIVLIEKEWVSFGHKFGDRLGWGELGWKDEERSPIFLQFLDCVYQCVAQAPNAFEFNEELLIFIAEYLHSGWFGNFLFNCERELVENKKNCVSIWTVVLNFPENFINQGFREVDDVVIPVVTRNRIALWSKWYLKWSDRIWQAGWTHESLSKEGLDVYGEVSLSTRDWNHDKTAKACKRCAKTFSLVRRRHHCRVCAQVFCEQCSNEYRIVQNISTWKSTRCCIDCAYKIDQQMKSAKEADELSNRYDDSALSLVSVAFSIASTELNSEFHRHPSKDSMSLAAPLSPSHASLSNRTISPPIHNNNIHVNTNSSEQELPSLGIPFPSHVTGQVTGVTTVGNTSPCPPQSRIQMISKPQENDEFKDWNSTKYSL